MILSSLSSTKSHEPKNSTQIHLVILASVHKFIHFILHLFECHAVWDVLLGHTVFAVLVNILLDIKESLQIPKCVISLVLSNLSHHSTLACHVHTLVAVQQLTSGDRARWFTALKATFVVDGNKLLQEQGDSVQHILLW